MNRPSKKQHRKKPKDAAATSLPRATKVAILAGLAVFAALFFTFEHFYWMRKATDHRELELSRWKARYHLNDKQVSRLRLIERQFHGSGDRLTQPAHTLAEDREHLRLLRETMNIKEAEADVR